MTVAAILAGGRSTRMGQDKAALPIAGSTLLARTVAVAHAAGLAAVVVGRTAPAGWPDPATRFLDDGRPGSGPLGGIHDALAAIPDDVLVLPCDLPRLDPAPLRWLLAAADGADRRAPVVAGTIAGRIQPLFALWRARSLPSLAQAFAMGERSPRRWLAAAAVATAAVPDAFHAMLLDCDTPADWSRLGAA